MRVTPERVWIGTAHRHFSSRDHKLKRVSIRDAGELNIMEITFENTTDNIPNLDEIRFPVPKGRLRDAIKLQTYFMEEAASY